MRKFLGKRGFAVFTSLALCASLVVPSFAATFTDLQNVIDGNNLYTGDEITREGDTITLSGDVTRAEGDDTDIKITENNSVTIDLAGHNITAGRQDGTSVLYVNGGKLTLQDSGKNGEQGKITGGSHAGVWVDGGGTFNMEGGIITDNSSGRGGGVHVQENSTFNMSGGEITGNHATVGTADVGGGGGVFVEEGSRFDMSGGSIHDNSADSGYGDNVLIDSTQKNSNSNSQFTMTGGSVGPDGETQSVALVGGKSTFTMDKDADVQGTIFVAVGSSVTGNGGKDDAQGNPFDGFDAKDSNGESLEPLEKDTTYTVEQDTYLTVKHEEPDTGGDTIIDDPDVPLGGLPDEVEIEEPDVPLAGLFTRADAIGYLWEQAGSPDAALSDFPDVSADHEWAVAIGWAQDVGIAVADLEGNFRPDDLLLRSVEDIELNPEGEFEQFLNRYAEFAGIELEPDELFIELFGEPDEIIMGEDAQVIFDSFFDRLELALAQAA